MAYTPLDLVLRSELTQKLTVAQGDANMQAIQNYINALLAGTANYEAGNALKLGGVAASSHWNNSNSPASLGASG